MTEIFKEGPLGQPLEKPSDNDSDCLSKHSHIHYSGKIPCTGNLICSGCFRMWDNKTGQYLGKYKLNY